jgi:hypothetical protein
MTQSLSQSSTSEHRRSFGGTFHIQTITGRIFSFFFKERYVGPRQVVAQLSSVLKSSFSWSVGCEYLISFTYCSPVTLKKTQMIKVSVLIIETCVWLFFGGEGWERGW